jgi:hypothetical protein
MEFWHLVLIFVLILAGLIFSLAYMLRAWARANSERLAAGKGRIRKSVSGLKSRLLPLRRKEGERREAPPPSAVTARPRSPQAAKPQLQPRMLGVTKDAPASRDDGRKIAYHEAERRGAGTSLRPRGFAAVRSGTGDDAADAVGHLTALFDRLERGDLPIEEFLKAVALEREEAERHMRCLEVLHGDRAMLDANSDYRQARDHRAAAIACQEWALEFRENLRQASV